jgi:hypothetical protein
MNGMAAPVCKGMALMSPGSFAEHRATVREDNSSEHLPYPHRALESAPVFPWPKHQ